MELFAGLLFYASILSCIFFIIALLVGKIRKKPKSKIYHRGMLISVFVLIVDIVLVVGILLSASYKEYDNLVDDYNSMVDEYDTYLAKMKPYEEVEKADAQKREEQAKQEQLEKDSAAKAAAEQAAAEQARQQEIQSATFNSGVYKVGADIPAGEYVVFAQADGYFAVTSDSTGSLESIVCNDNFAYNTIVTISDGQYFELNRANAIPLDKNPTIVTVASGTFKVGVHIPAGEYKVVSDGGGYMQVSSDSSHSMDSIISNNNFEGETYITVSDGQYLTLKQAHIQQ